MKSPAKNSRPLLSRSTVGRWLVPCQVNGVLLTVQVRPRSLEIALGMNPSICVFLPPMPRMRPSLSGAYEVWRPALRPPVSNQVAPSSSLAQRTDSPPEPSLDTYIRPASSRNALLIGWREWLPIGPTNRGKRISPQVAPLSFEVI